MNVTRLACEYASHPLGLDMKDPRFGWVLEAKERGAIQSAYRILVASSLEKLDADDGDKWDSGKVASDRSVNIPYDGAELTSGEKCWWKVQAWPAIGGDGEWSDSATFEMGLLGNGDWTGKWIGAPADDSSPLLRKEFEIPREIVKARLYVSGIGWSESYINGKKISDRVLDPCSSEYGKSAYYVVHDVTQALKSGNNAIGIWLANGWFSEPDSDGPGDDEIWKFSSRYGDSPRAMVKLRIELADGETLDVVSDAGWRTTASCITQNDFYHGERYDARLEKPGWAEPDFDDTDWQPATLKDAPGGRLRSQLMPPIRVVQTRKPISITEPIPGVYVCSFDQLFGGWVRVRVKGAAGQEVAIQYSERIHADTGLIDKRQHEAPKATDYYTLRGGDDEVYEPRFTYHPVRFVQIEGLACELSVDDVDGCVVHTDEDLSGSFECDNGLLNKIHQNVRWTLTNGLYGMPLDCLYREHWAWTDPASITGTLYPRKHMPRFWTKWLRDIADSQRPDGSVPVLCPDYKWCDWWDPAWGGNYPQLVWFLYQYYDDIRLLEEHYDGIKRTVDHLLSISEDFLIVTGFWGDHMLPGAHPGEEEFVSSETPRELVWTGYFYRGALAISQAAALLDRADDTAKYSDLAEKIKQAFNAKWLDGDRGIYDEGSQTSQAFPLALGIVPEQQQQSVVDCLINNITDKHNNHHHTGNTGTTCLIDCLTALGHGEIMWKIATNTTYPGWGYMIEHGATTIWEGWSATSHAGSADSMIMWATIDQFLYNDLAGIRIPGYYGPQQVVPGFKHVTIAPFIPAALDHAHASMRTVRGMISSSWQRTVSGITLDVTIPVNCTGTITVPKMGSSNVSVTEGNTTVWKDRSAADPVDGITGAAETEDNVIFEVGSGSYSFALKAL